MTYARVIPRDLFNEGNLLTCLGRLWIKLDEAPLMRRPVQAQLWHCYQDSAFHIDQDPNDGSISCGNVALATASCNVRLFRPLNARGKWPLYARCLEEDVAVFTDDGELTDEFWDVAAGRIAA